MTWISICIHFITNNKQPSFYVETLQWSYLSRLLASKPVPRDVRGYTRKCLKQCLRTYLISAYAPVYRKINIRRFVIVLYYRFCCKVKFLTRMGTCQECARTEAAGGRVLRKGCSSSSESILLHNKFRFWCRQPAGVRDQSWCWPGKLNRYQIWGRVGVNIGHDLPWGMLPSCLSFTVDDFATRWTICFLLVHRRLVFWAFVLSRLRPRFVFPSSYPLTVHNISLVLSRPDQSRVGIPYTSEDVTVPIRLQMLHIKISCNLYLKHRKSTERKKGKTSESWTVREHQCPLSHTATFVEKKQT